jgi:uncharacterized membrane protein YphA (DoxX/SURF4 family)
MNPLRGLALLRICLGVFFVFEALGKLSWLTKSAPLIAQLQDWSATAPAWSQWYVQTIALPGAPYFARLVMLGELTAGLALLVGVWTRTAALLAFLMVLNFHIASGAIFKYAFLTNGYGLPVLGGLLALAVGGRGLPWSLGK